jgi:membrane protein YdbS with pleckstrin-like domain
MMENLNKESQLKTQERSYLSLNRSIWAIVVAAISMILSIGYIFTPLDFWKLAVLLGIVWLVFSVIFIYLGAEYRHFSYEMNEYGLYINRGVFWRRKIVVPLNRVQHTDVIQGPFERKYQLAELVVHTAGTRNASVKLPGILNTDAEQLRESLAFDVSNDAV